MKQCILFDLDGVVINSEPLYEKATLQLMQKYNINIPNSDWIDLHGLSENEFYATCIKKYKINCSLNSLLKEGNRLVLEVFNDSKIKFNDGFFPLFNQINTVYDLALVTATSEKIFNIINQKINLSTYFSTIVFGGMTKRNKPFPDPYLYAIKNLNSSPKNCIVIEDSLPGLRSAKSANCKTIALASTIGMKRLPDFVDMKFSSLDKITKKTIDQILNN